MGKKGKMPWMVYNGEEVADSQFCIEYLNAKRGVDLNKHLTPEQKAIAKSFQIMVDEHSYWIMVYCRWFREPGMKLLKDHLKLPRIVWWLLKRRVWTQVWSQGIARHSPEEIKSIFMEDVKSLSNFIGTKSFLMGDVPCQEDCAVFGFLAQMVFHEQDQDIGGVVHEHFPNLEKYCIRMKETFWPDWDKCLLMKS